MKEEPDHSWVEKGFADAIKRSRGTPPQADRDEAIMWELAHRAWWLIGSFGDAVHVEFFDEPEKDGRRFGLRIRSAEKVREKAFLQDCELFGVIAAASLRRRAIARENISLRELFRTDEKAFWPGQAPR